jgi:hypothetical protein
MHTRPRIKFSTSDKTNIYGGLNLGDCPLSWRALSLSAVLHVELVLYARVVQVDFSPAWFTSGGLVCSPPRSWLDHTPRPSGTRPLHIYAPCVALKRQQCRTGPWPVVSSGLELAKRYTTNRASRSEIEKVMQCELRAIRQTNRILSRHWAQVLELQQCLLHQFAGDRSRSQIFWRQDGMVKWISYEDWVMAQEQDGTLPPHFRYD